MGNLAFADVMPYHVVPVRRNVPGETLKWCHSNIGTYGERWKTMNSKSVFCFQSEKDALMFILKYCN